MSQSTATVLFVRVNDSKKKEKKRWDRNIKLLSSMTQASRKFCHSLDIAIFQRTHWKYPDAPCLSESVTLCTLIAHWNGVISLTDSLRVKTQSAGGCQSVKARFCCCCLCATSDSLPEEEMTTVCIQRLPIMQIPFLLLQMPSHVDIRAGRVVFGDRVCYLFHALNRCLQHVEN